EIKRWKRAGICERRSSRTTHNRSGLYAKSLNPKSPTSDPTPPSWRPFQKTYCSQDTQRVPNIPDGRPAAPPAGHRVYWQNILLRKHKISELVCPDNRSEGVAGGECR